MNEELNTYLYPVSLTLLFAISCIVSFKRKTRDPHAGIFLALMYWSYFFALLIGFLGETGFIVNLPHLIRTGQIAALLFMPMSFMYVYRTFNPRPTKWTFWLLFLPAIIYIVDYSAFFLQPAEEKIALYRSMHHNAGMSAFGEGLFAPKGFHIGMRYVVLIGFWVAQVIFLRKSIYQKDVSGTGHQSLFSWLKWLTFTQLIIIIPPVINLIFPFERIWVVNQFSALTASIVQGYFLLLKPEILYGLEGSFVPANQNPQTSVTEQPVAETAGELVKQQSPVADQKKKELMDEILEKLELHFLTNKPFLKEGYSLPDLANELGYSSHQLSYLINKHYGINFYSLINQYRINACKEKLVLREHMQKTLEAIAQESGFHSRATFIRAFKTQTGVTPSAFIKNLQ